MTEKPPVPSDEEFRAIRDEAFAKHQTRIAEDRACWLAGCRAREARISELEAEVARLLSHRDSLRAQVTGLECATPRRISELESHLRNLIARIDRDGGRKQQSESFAESAARADSEVVRLLAEVAELRKSYEAIDACNQLDRELLLAMPRRTPELTERVGQLIAKQDGGNYWVRAKHYNSRADDLLGLVFGKKEE